MAFSGCEEVKGFLERLLEVREGVGRHGTEQRLELGKGQLDSFCHRAYGSKSLQASREGHASVRDRCCGRLMMRWREEESFSV